MKKILSILLSAGVFLAFTSCGGGAPKNFTVTYETEKGTAPAPIIVEENTVLTADQLKPIEAKGFVFAGWFDGDTEAKADAYTVTKDVTLTAKWAEYSYSNFVGSWELYDEESPEELLVFKFANDKTVILNMNSYINLMDTVMTFTFSGTYELKEGKISFAYDKYQTYDNQGNLVWKLLSELDPQDPTGSQYLDMIADFNLKNAPYSVTDKAIELTIDGDKYSINKMKKRAVSETGLCLDDGKIWYMYFDGGDYAIEYEFKFNADGSFLTVARNSDEGDISEMEGKGTYEVYHNFLFADSTEGTVDGEPLTPDECSTFVSYIETSTGDTTFCMEGLLFEEKVQPFGEFIEITK